MIMARESENASQPSTNARPIPDLCNAFNYDGDSLIEARDRIGGWLGLLETTDAEFMKKVLDARMNYLAFKRDLEYILEVCEASGIFVGANG